MGRGDPRRYSHLKIVGVFQGIRSPSSRAARDHLKICPPKHFASAGLSIFNDTEPEAIRVSRHGLKKEYRIRLFYNLGFEVEVLRAHSSIRLCVEPDVDAIAPAPEAFG